MTRPTPMSVSIVIAVRNGAATVAETIASLLSQTWRDWTAVIVDNGSVDGTADAVKAAAAGDPRISVVHWRDPGVSGARNHGLSHAKGDRILFLDADDTIRPDHLANLVAAARRHLNADVVYCDWVLAAPDGRTGARRRVDITADSAGALSRSCAFPIHAALTRAAAIAQIGGFAPTRRICEDWDLWQRLAFAGAVFRRSPEALATYRLSPGSASSDLPGFLEAGLDLIRQGHARLREVSRDAALDTAAAETGMALWLAGRALAAGRDAAALLDATAIHYDPTFDCAHATGAILDGMTQGFCDPAPDWIAVWPSIGPRMMSLLTRIEPRFALPAFARLVRRMAEQTVVAQIRPGASAELGTTLVQSFDIAEAPDEIVLSPGTERLTGVVLEGGRECGRFDLAPVGPVAADALAAVLFDFRAPVEAEADGPDMRTPPDPPDAHTPLPVSHWDGIFGTEDPWDYDNPYEALKYEQTLAAITPGADRALELACAEGHFTQRLAGKVGQLTATDISATAVERARQRCRTVGNVTFRVLDLLGDPLPPDQDLIVCSEVLYYFEDTDDLALIADRIAAALRPGGQLVMAHAYLTSDADGPRSIGFDWGHRFGARSIGAIFGQARDLALTDEFRSDLYVIQVFRRRDSDRALYAPRIARIPVSENVPDDVMRHADWAGRAPAALCADAPGVPVLMYHRITTDPAPVLGRYATAPEVFRSQMGWLAENGYSTISVDMLENAIWEGAALPDRPVVVTFDDGYHDNLANALPILADFNQTATVFVPTFHVGGTAEWDRIYGTPAPLMTWDDLGKLLDAGLTLASHGYSHRPMNALSSVELAEEATASRDALLARLGVTTHCIAYPYGMNDEAVQRALLSHGYRLAFTTQDRRWKPRDKVMAMPRVEVPGGISQEDFMARVRAT